jgi:CheY-like chemotaxis protein
MALKVLVVDDEPFMLRLIEIVLERDGYQMIKAANGGEAVNVARTERPCLVIMDAMMPQMDGMTALREIKSDPVTCSIPVVMLTANPHKFRREDAFSSGATVFLTKPFSPSELLSEIRRLTKRSGSDSSAGQPSGRDPS